MATEHICSKCGDDNPAKARFCNGCGAALSASTDTQKDEKEKKYEKDEKDPFIGRTAFDRFNVLEKIGQGGMGAVYLAEQKSIKRPVALKVLSSNTTGHPSLRERFRNEASLASRLNHPNTVTVYDFDITEDGTLFIAMELVQGKNLGEILGKKEKLDWHRVCEIIVQVSSSLQNAHDNNIIHRDLKPENIMLTDSGTDSDHVKVLDFGLAKILVEEDEAVISGLTSPNELFGTPDYMSPEQAKKHKLDNRTDIYSLGVIMYRMLTGFLPFEAGGYIEMMAKHIAQAPRSFQEVFPGIELPKILEELVMSTLAKSPDDRPLTMSDIIKILQNCEAPEEESEPVPTKKEITKQPPKKAAAQPVSDRPSEQATIAEQVSETIAEQVSETIAEQSSQIKPDLASETKAEQGKLTKADQVNKTLADKEDHFQDADSIATDTPVSADATLERLLRRIKKKKDFPVVSKNISELNAKAASSTTSASQLANLILKDPSLTVKLVRLVNSPFYGQLQGRITMVSRAVVLIGFNAVRDAALGVLLFDHLMSKDPKQAADLKSAAIGSLATAIISKEVAGTKKHINQEEAYISGLFKDLGRQAAMFYFPEEMNEAKRLMNMQDISESNAIYKVLGISLEQLSKELGKQWNFPDQVLSTMTNLPSGKISKPIGKTDQLRHITSFAGELSKIVAIADPEEKKRKLAALRTRFASSIKLDDEALEKLIEKTTNQILDYARAMAWGGKDNPLLAALMQTSNRTENEPTSASEIPGASLEELQDPENAPVNTLIVRKEKILVAGTEEVAKSIRGRFDINTVILMILETMFRGLSLNRVIFCLNDVQAGAIKAKSGFGDGVDEIINQFQFGLRGPTDIFRKAMIQGTDVIVNDSSAKKFAYNIPKWYKEKFSAPMFLIYPIRIKAFPAALFYGDFSEPNVNIDPLLLNQMNDLRDVAATAILKSYSFGKR